jgi:hypothetical protein
MMGEPSARGGSAVYEAGGAIALRLSSPGDPVLARADVTCYMGP